MPHTAARAQRAVALGCPAHGASGGACTRHFACSYARSGGRARARARAFARAPPYVACYVALLCMRCSFAFLGLSHVCNLVAPALLGSAMDALLRGVLPVSQLVIFGVLRFGVAAFDQLQRLVYLRVKQVAAHEIAVSTFGHLHSLSLFWHINKRSGVVLRALDRGINSAAVVVDNLFLRLGPAIIETIVISVLFAVKYSSAGSSVAIALSFLAYCVATMAITNVRTKQRKVMNSADNEANQVAVDALTAFETIKVFSAEEFELKRYSVAIKKQQAAMRDQQTSYIALQLTQSLIIRVATVLVLIFSAMDVLAGKLSPGSYLSLYSYTLQVFEPLSWLGAMYTMLAQAYVDMQNLGEIMMEQPDIQDAADAQPLRLENRALGATIEFRNVSFTYPKASNKLEASMAASVSAASANSSGQWGARLRT
ncbi:ABC transporter ATP-binding protein/permease, partial [archaeon]